MKWIKERLSEPSTYGAVGAAIVGVGFLLGSNIIICVGILGGVAGFVLKEKGMILCPLEKELTEVR